MNMGSIHGARSQQHQRLQCEQTSKTALAERAAAPDGQACAKRVYSCPNQKFWRHELCRVEAGEITHDRRKHKDQGQTANPKNVISASDNPSLAANPVD